MAENSIEEKFIVAAHTGDLEEVSTLLRDNPDLDINWGNENEFNWTALHTTAYYRQIEVVKVLLAHPRISVNARDH